jgi:hypothetical protein
LIMMRCPLQKAIQWAKDMTAEPIADYAVGTRQTIILLLRLSTTILLHFAFS